MEKGPPKRFVLGHLIVRKAPLIHHLRFNLPNRKLHHSHHLCLFYHFILNTVIHNMNLPYNLHNLNNNPHSLTIILPNYRNFFPNKLYYIKSPTSPENTILRARAACRPPSNFIFLITQSILLSGIVSS